MVYAQPAKKLIPWSFGRLTWPHFIKRAMLCEQLYRRNKFGGHPTIVFNHYLCKFHVNGGFLSF